MAGHGLVPFMQDQVKWTEHYREKGRRQAKRREMTRPFKEGDVKTSLVLPTTQLEAQAKSELKRDQKDPEVYAPIKATPQFNTPNTSTSAAGGSTTKKRSGDIKKGNPSKKRKNNNLTTGGRDLLHT